MENNELQAQHEKYLLLNDLHEKHKRQELKGKLLVIRTYYSCVFIVAFFIIVMILIKK